MKKNNYSEYIYELLPDTYNKLSNLHPKSYKGTWDLWKEGIGKKLIHPEFHGREHFNLKVFKEKLKKKDKELLTSLENRSLTSISDSGYKTITFSGAFKFWDFEENEDLKAIISSGLKEFENVFCFRATHFNSPGGPEHSKLHETLNKGGIRYIDEPLVKNEHQGFGKFKKKFYYTGKKNNYGQLFMVRNCVFEPMENNGFDWVNYTMKQIEIAFKLKRPAIISSHRVNYCGLIDENNRKKGVSLLKNLIDLIIKIYPNSEFISSKELGLTIFK